MNYKKTPTEQWNMRSNNMFHIEYSEDSDDSDYSEDSSEDEEPEGELVDMRLVTQLAREKHTSELAILQEIQNATKTV